MADYQSPTRFQRCIYWLYRRGSAFKYTLLRQLRPAGLLITAFIPLPWLLLPLHNQASIWQLRMLLFILPIISLILLVFRRGKITVSRETPRLATVGETVSYQVTVNNIGKNTLTGATIWETPPDNRPSLKMFAHSREPHEETRNPFDRTFCFYRWEWLQRLLTLFTSNPSSALKPLKANRSANIDLSLTPLRRGIIELTDIRLCLHDPLGLFQRVRKMPSSVDKIIVLPKRFRIPSINLSGDARFQIGGYTASNSIGQSGDFTSIREYQPGDAMKYIHWKSWARTGKPMVKEHEEVLFPRYGLVLDTSATANDAHLFEDAVSIASSFAATIDTHESMLDLMFIKDEAFTFSAGRGEEKIDKMLEILASVTSAADRSFSKLQKLLIQHENELSGCICILTGWCEDRHSIVSRLSQANMNLLVIATCSDLKTARETQRNLPSPAFIHWIRHGHIKQDLQTLTMK